MWWMLGIGWGMAGLTGLVWAAARAAAALTSGAVPGFNMRWATALIQGDTARTWPGTPTPLVLCLALAMIAFACGAVTAGWRFIARHLQGHLNKNDMTQKLAGAIHDFAKRQETWFRRMERQGVKIHWLEGAGEPLKAALAVIGANPRKTEAN